MRRLTAFFQIGNDPSAREALEELDDDLGKSGSTRDIVDTIANSRNGAVDADYIIKVSQDKNRTARQKTDSTWQALLGGVNRRIDKKVL